MIPADASFPENIQLAIFDLDATLVRPVKGNPKNPAFRANESDWQLLPGRVQAMRDLRDRHIEIGIATNQGGVAFRIHDPAKMAAEIWQAASMLGIYFVEFCFDHPNGARSRFRHDSNFRKPGGNMLRAIIEKAHVQAEQTLYIGDRDEDRQAAQNAECRFMTTSEFFAPYAHMSANPTEDAPHPAAPLQEWSNAYIQYLRSPFGPPITFACPGCGKAITTKRESIPLFVAHVGLCFDCIDPKLQATHPQLNTMREFTFAETQEK